MGLEKLDQITYSLASTAQHEGVFSRQFRELSGIELYNYRMQFLSISRRRIDQFPPEAFTPELVNAEAAQVRALYASGLLRQVWKRGDTPGAAILWEASSEEEVRAALSSLPIFKAGMLEVETLLPLHPYPGFTPAA